MKLSERVYLVGGGRLGFGISHDLDCHVYAIDGGDEIALVDAGAGVSIQAIIENMMLDGLDPARLRYVVLTHGHADHSGAAHLWRERFGAEVLSSPETSDYVSRGDEGKISLDAARRAGGYPPDFRFCACPISKVLQDEDNFRIGDLEVHALETPGHCSGMLSLYMEHSGHAFLFSGDTVFHSGKIMVSNVWDCDLRQYVHSIEKLARLKVDALLPGHLAIAMNGGASHIETATRALDRLALPPNLF
jgi:hydroxyacylglutathione hydrolase